MIQVDRVSDPEKIKAEAERRGDVVCISALSGEGLDYFCNAIQGKLTVRLTILSTTITVTFNLL